MEKRRKNLSAHQVLQSNPFDGREIILERKEVIESPQQLLGIVKGFYGFSKADMHLLRYVMKKASEGAEIIYLTPSDVKKRIGVRTNQSVVNCISMLISEGILARTSIPMGYYVNRAVLGWSENVTIVVRHGSVEKQEKVQQKVLKKVVIPRDMS